MSAQGFAFFGGVLGGIGKVRANIDESRALVDQAHMLAKTAQDLSVAKERATNLFDREIESFTAEQVSSYAKAGVDISSGSALAVIAQTRVDAFGERQAIRDDYENRIDNAMFEANQALTRSDQLRDPIANSLTFFSSLFGG